MTSSALASAFHKVSCLANLLHFWGESSLRRPQDDVILSDDVIVILLFCVEAKRGDEDQWTYAVELSVGKCGDVS